MSEYAKDIAVVTDSTCDIPPDLIQKHRIVVVPLYVLWGKEELLDGQDIDNPTFYARLVTDPIHPKTSQPTPADFVRAIEETGAREVVVITISRELSGSYDSAHQAAEEVDVPVHVVDSYSLSMGLGWQVLAAARERDSGSGVERMIAAAEQVREKLSLLLTVDTLEYLHRGGRIGGAAKLLGSVIQLKPLLGINHTTGTLEAVEKIRTRAKALQRVVEETFRRLDPASRCGWRSCTLQHWRMRGACWQRSEKSTSRLRHLSTRSRRCLVCMEGQAWSAFARTTNKSSNHDSWR